MNPQSSPFPLLCFSLTIFLLSTGYNLGSTEMISFQLTLLPYISLKLQASSVNIYESTKFPFSRVPLFIFLIGTGYNSGSIEMIGFKLTLLPYTIFKLQSYRGILSIDKCVSFFERKYLCHFFDFQHLEKGECVLD